MTHTTNDDAQHRSRGWITTLNNYTEPELAKVITFADECCKYAVIGKEVGKTGTPHLQCYFQMKTSYLGQTLKNKTSTRMWVGIANAPKKSREYCMKEGDYMEFGTFDDTAAAKAKGQARGAAKGNAASTAQWHALSKDIFDGATEKEIIKKYPHLYYKHSAGVARGVTVVNAIPKRDWKTCLHVYTGRPGCGKTTEAKKLCGDDYFEYSSPNKIWWTGYDGTQSVLFDDFHGNYPFDEFKKLTDKYQHKVPVHNGMMNFASKLMVVTSNKLPSEWWKEEVLGSHGMSALYRRINVLKIWSDAEEKFIDAETAHPMWNGGCCCIDPNLEETLCLDSEEEAPPPKLERQNASLDLSSSEFVPVPVPPTRLEFLGNLLEPTKRKTVESPPPPKKQKMFPKIPGKSIGQLTKMVNDTYGDPEPLYVDSSEDDIEDFSSDASDDISSSMSEEF